jgi:hypothetical protein
MRISEEIVVLFFLLYKTLIGRFQALRWGLVRLSLQGDFLCLVGQGAHLADGAPCRWHALLDTRNVVEDNSGVQHLRLTPYLQALTRRWDCATRCFLRGMYPVPCPGVAQ